MSDAKVTLVRLERCVPGLLSQGVDVKTVQTRLGHASASITLGWYAHAIPEKDHEAANLLGSLLAGNAEEGGKDVATADENPVETPENGEETGLEKMSPLCLQQGQTEAKKKQANRLKKAS